MIIMGIDPGLVNTAWGMIMVTGQRLEFLHCGTVVTKSDIAMPIRLHKIHSAITAAIESCRPGEVAMEESFVNSNPSTSLKLGYARGAIMLSIALAGLPYSEYSATLVKKSVVGVGRAEKHQVEVMVKHLLPMAKIHNEHEADALAIAICHSSLIRNRR